jgi:hypothetical protein
MVVLVRRRGSVDPIVDLLADKVDAEGNEGDAEARSGMAELIRQHRVLPPLVPPPEELSCGSQWLLCHFLSLSVSLSVVSSFNTVCSIVSGGVTISILASIWFCCFGLCLVDWAEPTQSMIFNFYLFILAHYT